MLFRSLRVERASADLTVPVALRNDGTIATRGERIDLTPTGRELTAEVAYDRPFGFATLGTFLGASRQPDHVAAAPLAGSTGMRLRLAW